MFEPNKPGILLGQLPAVHDHGLNKQAHAGFSWSGYHEQEAGKALFLGSDARIAISIAAHLSCAAEAREEMFVMVSERRPDPLDHQDAELEPENKLTALSVDLESPLPPVTGQMLLPCACVPVPVLRFRLLGSKGCGEEKRGVRGKEGRGEGNSPLPVFLRLRPQTILAYGMNGRRSSDPTRGPGSAPG